LAGVLRYIPYLGPWLAASLPLALAILMTRGWATPVAVVVLFLVLETINNMFLEPWLYGRNVGVSDAAAIVAVAFWTWLWGPIGLVLAFPLTVCLVVLGRYVPFLKFFDVLLGDQPALDPHVGFYQRLLAHDQDEATEIAEQRLAEASLAEVFDQVLVAALNYGRRDVEADLIDDVEYGRVLTSIVEIADELAETSRAAAANADGESPQKEAVLPRVLALACPARDETDQAALRLLAHIIDPDKCQLEILAPSLLATEVAARAGKDDVKLVCIGAVPPGGLAHARYLCKRLRACCEAKILVGRWGLKNPQEKNQQQLEAAGADYVAFSLSETRNQILSLASVVAAQDSRHERAASPPEPVEQAV
jgi:hypothetical protein